MITSINEFKSHLSSINEVRIPTGIFKVINNFMLPDKEGWDVVFSKEDIIEILPQERKIVKWNPAINKWISKEVDWNSFIRPEVYANFKQNSTKMDPNTTKFNIPSLDNRKDNIEFITTIKAFARKVLNLGLEDSTKVKVKVLE